MRSFFVPQQGKKRRQCGALSSIFNTVEVQNNKQVEYKLLVVECLCRFRLKQMLMRLEASLISICFNLNLASCPGHRTVSGRKFAERESNVSWLSYVHKDSKILNFSFCESMKPSNRELHTAVTMRKHNDTHFILPTLAPRDRKVAALAASLSLRTLRLMCTNVWLMRAQAKTEHGSGIDTATPGCGGYAAQPRAAWRARIRRPIVIILATLYVFLLFCLPVHAQLNISSTQPIQGGTALTWQFGNVMSATLSYQIRLAGPVSQLATVAQGQVNSAGGNATVSFTPPQPGVYSCSVSAGNETLVSYVAYRPFEIVASEEPPADWQSFWNSQKQLLNAVSPDVQVAFLSETLYTKTYALNMVVVGTQRLYGYLTIPTGTGPFPALIQLPPFGNSANVVTPNTELATRSGCIVLNLNIHPNPPGVAGPADYASVGLTDPTTNYYRHILLGVVRAINYLESRSDFNGKVGMMGESQGGGLAMLASGIDNRISVLIQNFAALADHAAGPLGLPSGFPYYFKLANDFGLNVQDVMNAARYYDAAHAVRFFVGDVYYIIAYGDDVCPANTLFSALNRLSGKVVCLHGPQSGHGNNPPEYVDYNAAKGIVALLRRLWPETQSPPWPWPQTTLGYQLDAGADKVLNAPGTTNVTASVKDENDTWGYEFLDWVQTAGPSQVVINNASQPTTSVTFNAPGIYELACRAVTVVSAGQVVSLHDRVKVFVAGDSSDTTPPVFMLTTAQNTVSGSFFVHIMPSEPVVGFTVSDLTIANGVAQQFQATANGFRVRINPQFPGLVTVSIAAQVVTDINDNFNLATAPLFVNFMNCPALTGGGQIVGDEILCDGQTAAAITNVQLPIGADGVHIWQKSVTGLNGNWTDIGGVTASSYTPPTPLTTTWYRRWSKASGCLDFQNGAVSNAVVKQVVDCSALAVCDISAPVFSQNYNQEWISLVEWQGMQQYSGPSPYTFFDQRVFTGKPGQQVDLRVGVGFAWHTHDLYLKVWLDKNNDGFIEPMGELVSNSYMLAPPNGSVMAFFNTTVMIPQEIMFDTLTMRVALGRGSWPLPCDTLAYGEFEDYRFVAQSNTVSQPESTLKLSPNPAASSTTLTWQNAAEMPDEVELVNALGYVLEKWKPQAQSTQLTINLNDLPDSPYYLVVRRPPLNNKVLLLIVLKP
jgi:cephalosporin-C deacetylase-like acetyl esterase